MDFEEWTSLDDVVLSRRDALSLSPAEGPGDDLFEAQLEDEPSLTVEVVLEDGEPPVSLAEDVQQLSEESPEAQDPVSEFVLSPSPRVADAETADAPLAEAVTVEAAQEEAEVPETPQPEVAPDESAELQSAELQSAELQSAELQAAELQAAELQAAELQAAELQAAELQAEELLTAKLQAEDLLTAQLLAAGISTPPAPIEALAASLVDEDFQQEPPMAPAMPDPSASATPATPVKAELQSEAKPKAKKKVKKKAKKKATPEVEVELEPQGANAVALADPVDAAAGPFDAAPAGLRDALASRGFESMTLVQEAVLASEAGDRDLQISSQTGSGKTIALGFVLARMLEGSREPGPLALVIVPTRELANQVCEELGWLFAGLDGVQVGSVVGGNPVWRDRQLLSRRPRVLVGTPGRLLDHVSSKTLDLSNVRELVLDEADQMLDMGFREELEGILDATPKERRTHMVSATFPSGIQRLAERYQRNPLAIQGTRLGHANADIEHRGHLIHQRDRFGVLVNLLLQAGDARTLIFVERRADTVEVAEKLESEGFAALPLSGELAQSQRERTLAAFRAGRATVLVATDVAARGLDVQDVHLVIHTAPPLDAETYTHRSGRTGRAGQAGSSVLLAAPSRRRRVARLMSESGIDFKWRPAPTAADVRALVAERHRDALATEIASALAAGASAARVDEAQALLAEHEPAALVAALLTKLEPAQRAEPREVEVLSARDERGPDTGRRERPAYGDRGRGNDRRERPWEGRQNGGRQERQDSGERYGSRERLGQRDRGDRGPRRGPDAPGEFVRFFVNWGENQGASPGRVLATVCRRGEVSGGEVGSIAVHPNASTFDVHSSVAERFEDLASRRDHRDPKTMIRRDRGPRPSGARAGR